MVTAHMWVGTAVLIAYLALAIVNGLQIRGDRTISWTRQLSMTAALLLLVQYTIGFGLLGGDHSITAFHYLIALAALIPVGIEHAVANTQEVPGNRERMATFAAAATTVLVLIAYAIAESR